MEKEKFKKIISFAAELALSLILIALLLNYVGMDEVIRALSRVNLLWFSFAVICYVFINLAMAYRIKLILESLSTKIRFTDIITAHFAGMLASDFTPARTGYFTTALILSTNEEVPLEKSMVSILGPQIFDFALKVTAGSLAILYIVTVFFRGDSSSMVEIGAGVLVLLSIIAVMMLVLFSNRFLNLFGFLSRFPFGEKLLSLLERMQKNSWAVKSLVPKILVILLFTWTLKALEWFFIARSVGISLDLPLYQELLFFAFLQPLLTMLQFIPFPTLAGIGLSEWGAYLVLGLFLVQKGEAVAFSLLTRIVMILVDLVGVKEAAKLVKARFLK